MVEYKKGYCTDKSTEGVVKPLGRNSKICPVKSTPEANWRGTYSCYMAITSWKILKHDMIFSACMKPVTTQNNGWSFFPPTDDLTWKYGQT